MSRLPPPGPEPTPESPSRPVPAAEPAATVETTTEPTSEATAGHPAASGRRRACGHLAVLPALTWGGAAAAGLGLVAPARAASSASPGATLAVGAPWRLDKPGNPTIHAATLQPEPRARHEARLFVFAPQARPAGPGGYTALFEREWRGQFGGLDIGDTVAHYRGRLPGGVNAGFMGRFFQRQGQGSMYAVLYLLDLGERVQFIAASVAPGYEGVGYPAAVDGSAHQALSQALFPVLDSIRPPGAAAPAAAPLFAREELLGRWTYASGGYGGSFVDGRTGGSLGAAVRGASSELALEADGRYRYQFAMYAVNPATRTDTGTQAQGHEGRYEIAGDLILMQPRQATSLDTRRKVAGVGTWASPQGPRRVLVLLSPEAREFKPVPWVPVWDQHAGIMHWYRETA